MPGDPTTFSGLKTSLANWLNRDDLSTTEIPEAIAFAEREFQRTVHTPDREEALSISADAQSEALPSDFWGFKSPPYVDGSPDRKLTRATPAELRSAYPDATTGTPAHFAIEGENILFGPTPASATAIKGTYYKTIPALSDANTTNWLLTDHPDLYLNAALAHLHTLLKDYDAANYHRSLATGLVEQVNKAGGRRSANSGPLVATHSTGHVRNIQA